MRLPNRDGQPVDPVPWLVIAGSGTLVSFSFFPGYCIAFGLPTWAGVAIAGGVSLLITGISFHQYLWTVDPAVRREIPPEIRLRTLTWAVLVGVGVLVALSLLFLVR